MKLLRTGVLLALFPLHLWASCPYATFSAPDQIQLPGKKLLIVTHVSTVWDHAAQSKAGMDKAVKLAKANKIPVVYLQHEASSESYFYDDCDPTYYYSSSGGEFNFEFDATEIVDIGGHFEACERISMENILRVIEKKHPKDYVKITQYSEGIYTYGHYNKSSDKHARDFYGLQIRLGRGNNSRTSLYDLLSFMKTDDEKVDYFTRQLTGLTMPGTHNVVISINGEFKKYFRKIGVGYPNLELNLVTKRVDEAPEFLY